MTITFEEACQFHAMVERVAREAKRTGHTQFITDVWDAATGHSTRGLVADAVRATVPMAWVPLLVSEDGIPAAYLTATLARYVRANGVDVNDDFAVRTAITASFCNMEARRRLANNVQSGFGCDDSLAWATVRDVEEDGDEVVKDAMEQIARLAGQMFDVLNYVRVPRPTDDPQEYDGAKTGGDLDRLLPEEVAKLDTDGLGLETAERIVGKKALQYKMHGQSTKSRGPLVLVLDESESMGDYGSDGRSNYFCKPNGRRNVWAKACAVALARIARLEGRKVRVVHFSTATKVSELDSDEAVIRMARHFLSGGTSIPKAMERGITQVGDLAKQGFDGADIILITDGEDADIERRPDLFDSMDAQSISLWTISIASRQSADKIIRRRAKKYIHVDDCGLDENAVEGLEEAALDNHRRGGSDEA
jgi:hypothetical protein